MSELFVTSSLLPVPHGFSTRHGGVSQGPYASLNLGLATPDERGRVVENHRLLAVAAGVDLSSLFTVSQVHGNRVLKAGGGTASPGEPPSPCGEADALWTDAPGAAVGVRTADCVPVLIVDPAGRRVAAVHSGWKGTAARVAARAVEALVREGSRPGELLAAIGPSIRACCYQVSAEVAGQFGGLGPGVVIDEGGALHLDLAIAVRRTLTDSGVSEQRVELLPDCTSCDPVRFFSHRRDRGTTGRQLSFAVCRF
ncbi:MAG: peptidoglycan editing factor PgeF [Myxococcaceae bacterium]